MNQLMFYGCRFLPHIAVVIFVMLGGLPLNAFEVAEPAAQAVSTVEASASQESNDTTVLQQGDFTQSAVIGSTNQQSVTMNSTDPLKAMFRLVFGLFVVLVVILGLAWSIKRWVPKSMLSGAGRGGSRLQVLESVSLGMKRQVHLIACQDKWILVGQSEQGLQAISEMQAPSLVETPSFAGELSKQAQQVAAEQVAEQAVEKGTQEAAAKPDVIKADGFQNGAGTC